MEKFPGLGIIGSSGTGKSQTVERVSIPIFNLDASCQHAAAQATPFTTIKLSSSSNTSPYILNELKQNKLNQTKLDAISHLFNNSYDHYVADRGRANQSIKSYCYQAPPVLIGEFWEPDQSNLERCIRIVMSKTESMLYTKSFVSISEQSSALKSLGKSLLRLALQLEAETLRVWIEQNRGLTSEKISTSRSADSLAKSLCGLDLLFCLVQKLGLSYDLSAMKESAIERYIYLTH